MVPSCVPSKPIAVLWLSLTLGMSSGDAAAPHMPLVLAPQPPSASIMGAGAVDDRGRFSAPWLDGGTRDHDVALQRARGEPIAGRAMGSGPGFDTPLSIAVAADGALIVLDVGLDAVFSVDRLTGDRAIISGCTVSTKPCPAGQLVGRGPPLEEPRGIAVEGLGTFVVTDILREGVIRIDPVTGDRTIVSGCTEVTLPCPSEQLIGDGPAIMIPEGIAVEPTGTLVVITRYGTIGVLRIDPLTGDRDVLAAFPSHGGAFSSLGPLPNGIAVEADGSLVVTEWVWLSFQIPFDGSFGYPIRGAVTRIDAATGERTIVSTDRRFYPSGIAIEADGVVVVTEAAREAIVRVHPVSGDRSIVSGCAVVGPVCPAPQLVGGGPAFLALVAVAVEPEGTLVAINTGRNALMSVHPVSGDRTILSQ